MGSNPIRPAIYFPDQCVHLQGIILLSNEQSSGPSDFILIGICFIHSECLPFLQNQQIS
ncbi:uncharacterized protein METZ01_LOCUS89554 [marine metagenome]|uniref:Uncharacterized protein n=1 Tax=marine metagenome TaxID=408172 RepID=A0A381V8Q8_9ZZZZ